MIESTTMTKPKKSVKQAYQDAGWTAPKIAAELGINHVSVYRWQAGAFKPRLPIAMRFAELCGLRMDEIDWGGDEADMEAIDRIVEERHRTS